MNRILLGALIAVATIAVLMSSATVGQAPRATGLMGTAGTATTALVCGQTLVPLGTAGNFRVLAASTVTNTGTTVVTGNLGVSPGTAVSGFPPGVVTGTIHKNDPAAKKAHTDLVTAFHNASLRTNCPVAVSGNLGGKTLGPGLYVSTSGLAISSGNLTLDAHGHSGAVFIFKMASTFSISSAHRVILTGGANASHVFWIVGSSATFGTTSVVYGNVLASASITMKTGAQMHGRALAISGAVTLDKNKVRA